MKQIEIVCIINNSGYSQAAQNYAKALSSINLDVCLSPLNQPVKTDIYISNLIEKKKEPNRIQAFLVNPDFQRRIIEKQSYTVGFGIFETFSPPEHWVNILNRNTKVFCPSIFCKNEFEKQKTNNVFLVPHTLDSNIWIPNPNRNKKFTFLYIATNKERKNLNNLIKAHFESNVDSLLYIKTDCTKNIFPIKESISLNKQIIIDTNDYTEKQIVSLMNTSHVLISPSIGEGFNLPALQAKFLGIPTVVTNFGGSTDFCNDRNSILLEPEGFKEIPILDNIMQFRNKVWSVISSNNIKNAMEKMYKSYNEQENIANKDVKNIVDKYSYNVIANNIKNILQT